MLLCRSLSPEGSRRRPSQASPRSRSSAPRPGLQSTDTKSAFPEGGASGEEGQGCWKELNKTMTFYLEGLFLGLKRSWGAAGPRPPCFWHGHLS